MLQAYVSLQQPWPCKAVLIYFKTPKGEFFDCYVPLFDRCQQGLYLSWPRTHPRLLPAAFGCRRRLLQDFGAEQRDKLPSAPAPSLPASVAAPTAITVWSGHTFFFLPLLVLDSKPNLAFLVLLPQCRALFPFRSVEPVSSLST